MRINQNVAAFNAYRNLTQTNRETNITLERLSSSYRINRASDDAAGLVRSENLRTEVSGTLQALNNAQDGISFIQTSEGALSQAQAILQRVRALAIDAASTASSDGIAQQTETTQLLNEFEAIGQRATFGGIQSFQDFTTQPLVFHIGAGSAPADELLITEDLRLDLAFFDGGSLVGIDVTTDPDAVIVALDSALATMSGLRAVLGANQNRLEQTVSSLQVAQENLSASESRIRDTDMALEMVNLARHQILQQAGTAMLAQANMSPESVVALLNR